MQLVGARVGERTIWNSISTLPFVDFVVLRGQSSRWARWETTVRGDKWIENCFSSLLNFSLKGGIQGAVRCRGMAQLQAVHLQPLSVAVGDQAVDSS